jgi:hypothetical protein
VVKPVSTKIKISFLIVSSLVLIVILNGIMANAEQAATQPPFFKTVSLELNGVDICLECHDSEQTMGFHYPETIMKIEEKKGLRRRICMDCHGPEGADPDSQMTESRFIEWIEEESYYRVKSEAVHGIHERKLKGEVLMCETCHLIKPGDPTQLGIYLDIPKPNPGQILVCQLCHSPSDPGNYIAVHIVYGHQDCNTCHTGDLLGIHKRATAKLGQVS